MTSYDHTAHQSLPVSIKKLIGVFRTLSSLDLKEFTDVASTALDGKQRRRLEFMLNIRKLMSVVNSRCRRIMFRAPHVGGGIYEVNQKQHISILNTGSAELQRQMNANFKNFNRKNALVYTTLRHRKWKSLPYSLHHTASQEVEILAR